MKTSTTVPIERFVRRATGARGIVDREAVQSLWSGYGQIERVELDGAEHSTIIVKHVAPPTKARHPRGWTTDRSHERKLESYAVEMKWYQTYASRCSSVCRAPRALACHSDGQSWLFALEDLDAAGFPRRLSQLSDSQVHACLRWLAHFHATFLHESPEGLWKVGTYWHLGTRPDELSRMQSAKLKAAAAALDARLNRARYRSFVHGDAKSANFCFPADPQSTYVAAVDFQYAGGGPGIKDVAYFFSSIWDSAECETLAGAALLTYFDELRSATRGKLSESECDALQREWQALYPVAWADFYRFLDGWAPGHYKMHGYSRRMADLALASL